MKWISLVGAVLALSLVGASSASASTVFCKTNTSPCPAGQEYPVGTAFKASLDPVLQVYSNILPRSECISGKLNGQITATGVSFTEFAANSCSSTFQTCSFSGKALPWSSTLSAGSGGDGTLTVSKAKFVTGCSVLTTPCEFEASNVALGVKHVSGQKLWINSTFTAIPATGCRSDETKRLEGSFSITSPAPLYVQTQ